MHVFVEEHVDFLNVGVHFQIRVSSKWVKPQNN